MNGIQSDIFLMASCMCNPDLDTLIMYAVFPDYQHFEKVSPSSGYFGTIHDKQIRYHRAIGVTKCHRKLVREELVWNIKQWKQYDEIILLIMDANKYLNQGKLAKGIRKLGIHNLVKERTGKN